MAKAPPALPAKTAAGRYAALSNEREAVLTRARECAKLTIPSLMPPSGHTQGSSLREAWQSVGARGVNSLASKLLLALLPPEAPFFRLQVEGQALMELERAEDEPRGAVETALNMIEMEAHKMVQTNHLGVTVFEALKQLIVAGNALLFWPTNKALRLFKLDQYAVLRDPLGNLLEIVVKEEFSYASLPAPVRELLTREEKQGYEESPQKSVPVYTWVRREPKDRFSVRQEVQNGGVVPKSEGFYPADKLPWLPLRMVRVSGESYGRSYVEEYLGDLRSLEALRQAIVEASAAAAKVIFLVRPNGTTRPKMLADLKNLGIGVGNRDDISVLQLEKFADLRIAFQAEQEIQKALELAFLMTASIQRQAERVTAEEIRRMAQDLDATLGGVYSLLTQELLMPLAGIILDRLTKKRAIPSIEGSPVRPTIIAGVAAIGRGSDYSNLLQLLSDAAQVLGPEVLQRVNAKEVLRRLAAARGVSTPGLLRTDNEIAQEQQQTQANRLVQESAPKIVEALATQAGGAPMEMSE